MTQPRYDVPKAAPAPLLLVQEFVNTADHEHEREWLVTPEDLRAWLAARHLVPESVRVGRADLRTALELREALRALLRANSDGSVGSASLETLDRVAQKARLTVGFDWRRRPELVPLASGLDAALGRIVVIVFVAMVDGSWQRLKACRNCRWAFYDYSKNRSASWCSMSICGNRLKGHAYRERRRRARTPERAG
jgi:predicted RNA-binding Zn ribbon-like protein